MRRASSHGNMSLMPSGRITYQLFISSTFRDLHSEREAVSWAVLKTRNIPAGMEAFPATDDRGWKTIQRTIDDSDFYILILGYRYGSIDAVSGLSWTEKEYRYAKGKGIPVLAFLREMSATPLDHAESDAALRAKMDAFRQSVQDSHHVKPWKGIEDLVTLVSQAIPAAIQDSIDDGAPREGWVRGSIDAIKIAGEMASLSEENRMLREQLRVALTRAESAVAERAPSLLHHSAGGSSSANEFSHAFLVQNVGTCGFVVEGIIWLWKIAGKVTRFDHAMNEKQPQFVAPGEKSSKFNLALTKRSLDAAAGTKVNISTAYGSIQITAIVSATSKPHNITCAQSFAIKGELLSTSELERPSVADDLAPSI